jgi:hypothetical protein
MRELPCDQALGNGGSLYFYAQAEAPDWEFDALICNESGKPFEPPTCRVAEHYAAEDGVLSVLCGEWPAGADRFDYLADFARIVERMATCEDGTGGMGGAGGSSSAAGCP